MGNDAPETSERRPPDATGAGSGPRSASRTGLISSFVDGIKKKSFDSVITAVLAVIVTAVTTVTLASWGYLQKWTKDFIVEATVLELNKENNRLLEPIKKTIERLRSSEIGALNVGNFVLTTSNPQYLLPIYIPSDHVGQLSIMLTGDLMPKESYVVLMLPNGKKFTIDKAEVTIDLAAYMRMESSPEPDEQESLVLRPGYLKGLRTLTFQLAGSAAQAKPSGGDLPQQAAKAERAIHVRYLALVSPSISMIKTQ